MLNLLPSAITFLNFSSFRKLWYHFSERKNTLDAIKISMQSFVFQWDPPFFSCVSISWGGAFNSQFFPVRASNLPCPQFPARPYTFELMSSSAIEKRRGTRTSSRDKKPLMAKLLLCTPIEIATELSIPISRANVRGKSDNQPLSF